MKNKTIASKNILIVDDEQNIRRVLCLMLEKMSEEGYDIHTVESGEKAIEFAQQHCYERAFIDMQMQGIDGLDTLRELKKIHPQITVYIMTGGAEQKRIDAALAEGAVGCLRKPFTQSEIERTLQK